MVQFSEISDSHPSFSFFSKSSIEVPYLTLDFIRAMKTCPAHQVEQFAREVLADFRFLMRHDMLSLDEEY